MSSAVEPASATTEEVVAELRRRSSFMFVSHVKPDGDTLGAGLALGLALKTLGKRVGYFQQDPVPRNLRFLPDTDVVSREVAADLPADTLWVFGDMSDFSRAGEFLPVIARENMLNIDHHLGNSRFGFLNYILETEASTGTCVLRILKAMKVPVTPDIATCILTTIMTDTGAFMHTNTTADVLRMSADLMERISLSLPIRSLPTSGLLRPSSWLERLRRRGWKKLDAFVGRSWTRRCWPSVEPTVKIPKRSCSICAPSRALKLRLCSKTSTARCA
jgi:hypothetical protein